MFYIVLHVGYSMYRVQTPYHGRYLTATLLLFFQLGGDKDSCQSTMSSSTSTGITENVICTLCHVTNPPPDDFLPVVQLIDLQKKNREKKPTFFVRKLILSDGKYFCKGALGTNLFSMVDDGLLPKLCFIKLTRHRTTVIGKSVIVLIQDLVVVDNDPGYIRGSPIRFEPSLDEAERERRKGEPVSIVKGYFLQLYNETCNDVHDKFRLCKDCGCAPYDFIGRGVKVMSFINGMNEEEELHLTHRQLRFLCYMGYAAYKHGYLGKYNRIKLPDCVECGFKSHYNETELLEFTGFRYKEEEEAAPKKRCLR